MVSAMKRWIMRPFCACESVVSLFDRSHIEAVASALLNFRCGRCGAVMRCSEARLVGLPLLWFACNMVISLMAAPLELSSLGAFGVSFSWVATVHMVVSFLVLGSLLFTLPPVTVVPDENIEAVPRWAIFISTYLFGCALVIANVGLLVEAMTGDRWWALLRGLLVFLAASSAVMTLALECYWRVFLPRRHDFRPCVGS